MSYCYSVFGGTVASDLRLPELSGADGVTPDWTLKLAAQRLSPPDGRLLGKVVKDDCAIALWRTESGYRMQHSCVGEYDISADGSRIILWRYENAREVAVQNDLVSRILPLLFHSAGALCLHASAVLIDGKAIVFVADARFGKSTLACALVRAGAQVASDDVAIIGTQPNVVLRPVIEHLRLRRDTTLQLARDDALSRSALDGKHVLHFESARRASAPDIPVGAIYLLAPVVRECEVSVLRARITERAAAMLLVRHSRLGRMLCGADGSEMVRRAAAVAREAPIYVLHVVRDLKRINEVATQVLEWHEQPLTLATGTHG